MAGIDDILKGNMSKTLALGVGAIVLAPVVIPALASVSRPLAKAAIKSGIILFEKGRETFAEFGEVMEDLVAEAKAEVHQPQFPQPPEQAEAPPQEVPPETAREQQQA